MSKIAWIGTGVMGAAMAGHLSKAGHRLFLYNRTHSKAENLAKALGAASYETIAETVSDADYIFSMVGYPQDVEEIMLQREGIFDSAKKGTLIIDMTTSLPSLALRLFEEGQKRGLRLLDAPVSGGDLGAKNATLSIMVGGEEKDFQEATPLFQLMGKNIVYMGKAGMGQHTKAANQIAVAGATAAMTEAIFYARNVGLDPNQMLNAIGAGAAGSWQLQNMAPRVLKEDFAPGFFVKHFIKDMKIVKAEMEERNQNLEMLNTVLDLYEKMSALGLENEGTQALIRLYNQKN